MSWLYFLESLNESSNRIPGIDGVNSQTSDYFGSARGSEIWFFQFLLTAIAKKLRSGIELTMVKDLKTPSLEHFMLMMAK